MKRFTQKNHSDADSVTIELKESTHHERRHTGEMPFHCKQCNNKFKHKSSLNLHMRYHNGERTHQCPFCTKIFTQSTHLLTHKRAIHLSEKERKTFDCVVCSKTLKSKQALETHMVVHSDQRAFKCDLCPKSFKLKQHFKIHILTQHTYSDEEFKCKMCSKVLTQARTLANHVKEVHEKASMHQCDICDYNAARKSTIKIHTDAVHSDVKFTCPKCAKKIAYKSHLTKHKKHCRV